MGEARVCFGMGRGSCLVLLTFSGFLYVGTFLSTCLPRACKCLSDRACAVNRKRARQIGK